MSKSTSAAKGQVIEDIWMKLESNPPTIAADEDSMETTTIVVGDSASGKSSLIQSFLKPTVTKEPKPTFALEYNFARKKASQTSSKCIAHIWELGGDIHEPKLLEIPLTKKTIRSTAIIICCDMSKPQNAMATLQRWIKLVRELIKKRITEMQATDSELVAALRSAATSQYQEHPNDASRARPCEIPLYIVATKYDVFKTMNLGDRRSLMQLIRMVAHYHGASLITTSSVESSSRESFRNFMNAVCFKSSLRLGCDVALDKPIYVTAGKDDFESILLSSVSKTDGATGEGAGKSRLLYSEGDVSNFVSAQGVTRDCWSRFSEHMVNTFGTADPAPENGDQDDGARPDENEFPESEIDEMRAQRDIALQRYIQESERKEALLVKMNAPSASGDSSSGGGGGSGGGEEGAAPADQAAAAPQKKRSSRK